MKEIRSTFSCAQVADAYRKGGSIHGAANLLGVSYGVAQALVKSCNIDTKPVGYSRPTLSITGLQCRHAREYLGMSRDEFCLKAGIGKTSLRQFELGKSRVRVSSLEKIIAVFSEYSISFDSTATFTDKGKDKCSP